MSQQVKAAVPGLAGNVAGKAIGSAIGGKVAGSALGVGLKTVLGAAAGPLGILAGGLLGKALGGLMGGPSKHTLANRTARKYGLNSPEFAAFAQQHPKAAEKALANIHTAGTRANKKFIQKQGYDPSAQSAAGPFAGMPGGQQGFNPGQAFQQLMPALMQNQAAFARPEAAQFLQSVMGGYQMPGQVPGVTQGMVGNTVMSGGARGPAPSAFGGLNKFLGPLGNGGGSIMPQVGANTMYRG
jgi:hypothetical protein